MAERRGYRALVQWDAIVWVEDPDGHGADAIHTALMEFLDEGLDVSDLIRGATVEPWDADSTDPVLRVTSATGVFEVLDDEPEEVAS